METRRTKWIVTLTLFALLLPAARAGAAILIHDVYGLQDMEDNLAGQYILANDIDATPTNPGSPNWDSDEWPGATGFRPIGAAASTPFTGRFAGAGHTITGLFTKQTVKTYTGLFGYFNGVCISHVTLADADIAGKYAGAVAGANGGTVLGCHSSGHVTGAGASSEPGGLVGMSWGTVSGCTSSATVTSDENNWAAGGLVGMNWGTVCLSSASGSVTTSAWWAGGLIGDNNGGTITECYSTGAVHADTYVGGLIGEIYKGTVKNCYARGEAHAATDYAGGLIGRCSGTQNSVLDSYATGDVNCGGANHGGLIGHDDGTAATDCFWDTQTSGEATSDGGTGKTTAEMKDVDTFTDTATVGLTTAWDFVGNPDVGNEDLWDIDVGRNNGYPYLIRCIGHSKVIQILLDVP